MGSGEGVPEQFVVDRILNILQSGDRAQKVSALKNVKGFLSEEDEGKLSFFYEQLNSTLLRLFKDPNEGVREHSINLMKVFLVDKLPKNKLYLKDLIPVVYSRLCSESHPEGSEEIKLIYSNFLTSLIIKYEQDLVPYVEEMVLMIVKLLPEPAPEVKKSASTCCISLINTLPAETFQFTRKFVNPFLSNLLHQHWRVRVSTIEALEILMLKGDNKCVPDVVNPITRCLFDDIEHVRMATTKLAGHWMTDLFDRYSFFSQLLPVILTSLNDESSEIRTEANNLWEKAGRQYLQENEKDYKDRKDYENELEHYPQGVKRPGLGCRIIVEQEGSKFLLALVKELSDWNEKVKIISSTLLLQYTLHAETSLTQSLHKIINGMCKAAMDYETPKVIENVQLAAQYMGHFVPPSVYCALIISHLKEANAGELRIVSGLVQGSQSDQLKPHLPKVGSLLKNNTFQDKEHVALLELISSIFATCGTSSLDIGGDIWAALISIAGLTEMSKTRQKALDLLSKFVELGGGDKRAVYISNCSMLLNSLLDVVWTAHCPQQFILTSVIENAGEIVEDNVDLFISIFKGAMDQENDPEVILKVTMAINGLISNEETTLPSKTWAIYFIKTVLRDIILTHLKWRPGRSAESVRTVACTCLYMCLLKVATRNNSISEINDIKELGEKEDVNFESLIPLVVSLIEDAAPKTRILSLNCIKVISQTDEAHETEQFYNLMTNVIKRLEDSDKEVRLLGLKCVQQLYKDHIGKSEERNYINKGLLEFVYSTLLIHLDDQQPTFAQSVLDCLQTIGKIDAELMRRKLEVSKFRNKEICEKLIEYIENHLMQTANS